MKRESLVIFLIIATKLCFDKKDCTIKKTMTNLLLTSYLVT